MDTFKTFKIIKNYTSECLQWSNKDWKTFFKNLPTKQILCKMLSWQTEKCLLQTLRTFIFKLKVASKPFSKKLPMTNFDFRGSWRLRLTFPENGFNFVTQKLQKTEYFHACSMNFKRGCLINGQRGTKIERTFTPK